MRCPSLPLAFRPGYLKILLHYQGGVNWIKAWKLCRSRKASCSPQWGRWSQLHLLERTPVLGVSRTRPVSPRRAPRRESWPSALLSVIENPRKGSPPPKHAGCRRVSQKGHTLRLADRFPRRPGDSCAETQETRPVPGSETVDLLWKPRRTKREKQSWVCWLHSGHWKGFRNDQALICFISPGHRERERSRESGSC